MYSTICRIGRRSGIRQQLTFDFRRRCGDGAAKRKQRSARDDGKTANRADTSARISLFRPHRKWDWACCKGSLKQAVAAHTGRALQRDLGRIPAKLYEHLRRDVGVVTRIFRGRWALRGLLVVLLLGFDAAPVSADIRSALEAVSAGDYAVAVREFFPPAEAGDRDAQYWLGRLYDEGKGIQRDRVGALGWFRKAADQEHADAQRIIGVFYEEGTGVAQSHSEAAQWFARAARQGNAKALRNLGSLYLDGRGLPQDLRKAMELFEKAAEQGNAKAKRNLAYMYYFGEAVVPDFERAARLFAEAAAAGLNKAEYDLGRLYFHGHGVERNHEKAAAHFENAATGGHPRAQLRLGRMYLLGDGVAKDYWKSYYWLTLAAAQEPKVARANLRQVRNRLSVEEIAKVEYQARIFKPR